jgi:galactitol-specific phosphotransferase system IIB component
MEMHLRSTKAKVVLIRNLVDKKEIREKILAAIYELQGKPE